MKMKKNNPLLLIVAVIFVIVFVVMMMNSELEHIEDTNGPDDISLTTITDQDILDHTMGVLNFTRTRNGLNGTVIFDSDKFTGVKEIMWTDVLFSTGVTLDLMDYQVNAGNFRMVVVHEGEIIRDILPGEDRVDLGQIEGHISLIVAGESADFSFTLFRSEYDSYAHED